MLVHSLFAQEIGEVEKLDSRINTDEYDEAGPVIDLRGDRLYFTRTGAPDFDRALVLDGVDVSGQLQESAYRRKLANIYSQIAGKPVRDPYLSPYNQDIHIATIRDGAVDSVYHPGVPLNNAFPNSVMSAAGDTSWIMVMNQFYESGSMYEGFSQVDIDSTGTYGYPEPVHIYDFSNRSGNVSLALNYRGNVMLLSLEREDSRGKNDLYVSFKISKNLWSKPENIGSTINTPSQESTPYITKDGRFLYFSSDRPGSIGGMDIWVSTRLDYTWKKWTDPQPLTEPINSPYDDAQASVDAAGEYMYFASRRDGSSDIYRVSLLPRPQLSKPVRIKGRIVDGDTGRPIRAKLYWGPESLENYLEYFRTYTGEFEVELLEYDLYKFFARKTGYQPAKLKYDARLADMQDRDVHYMVLKLYKAAPMSPDSLIARPVAKERSISQQLAELSVGEELSFYNIYFEQSKADVLESSFPALDALYSGLMDNPDVKVQVEGHTDNVGNPTDLMELSWQRANAIKEYLVEKGIDDSRLVVRGFGPDKPIVDNLSEANRKKNRRVEVRILARAN